MMYGALWILFHDKRVSWCCPLRSFQDMEVVVCCMSASVAFRAKRGAEDDQIFGDRGVDEVH